MYQVCLRSSHLHRLVSFGVNRFGWACSLPRTLVNLPMGESGNARWRGRGQPLRLTYIVGR